MTSKTVRVDREETIPVPFVRLRKDDLGDIANRIENLAYAQRARITAEVDADLAEAADDGSFRRSREDELKLQMRFADRPKFVATTRYASFSGEEWAPLWEALGPTGELPTITMRWDDRVTTLEVQLQFDTRRTSASTNRVHIKSADSEIFDREIGFFQRLFKERRRVWRERLTTGWADLLFFRVIPAFILGFAIQLALLHVRGFTTKDSTLLNDVLWGATFGFVLLMIFGWVPPRVLLAVAPRLELEDAGQDRLWNSFPGQLAIGIVATLLVAAIFTIWAELIR